MILKVSSGPQSWLVDATGVAHPIINGGDYQCLAARYPVRYHLDPARFAEFAPGGIGTDATCPPGTDAVRIDPAPEYGIRSVMLREADGTAWVIDQNGLRTPVADGPSFNCFAEQLLVWDDVEGVDVYRFAPEPGIVARFCIP